MKKDALLIVLFFSFFGSYAQSYIPFPEKDAEWVSRILYEDPQSKGGDYCYNSHIKTDGDTIINGLKYIKLTETKIHRIYRPFVCMGIDTAAPITTKLYGWMRNDSANEKVYFRRWNQNTDALLYDFDKQIGDTISSTLLQSSFFGNDPIILDTVFIRSIGGVNRAIYKYKKNNRVIKDSIIEGIGNSNGLFAPYFFSHHDQYTFLCMKISGAEIFPLNGSCPIITSLSERGVSGERVKIIPNPTSSHFRVEKPSSLNVGTAGLYDYTGREVKKFLPNSEYFDVQEIPSGIYLFRININGYFYSEKIVVQ